MEHIIQEHNLVDPLDFPTGEVVLHCMSCDDWVSTKDSEEVIAEFRNAPCPGARQHDDDEKDGECIAGLKFYSQSRLYGKVFEVSESPGFCDHRWKDDILRKHEEHSCYLDKGHKGGHICGFCVEGYDALESEADEYEPKDDGGPVFPSPFYHGPDFDKKED